jgi:hypothetical protein
MTSLAAATHAVAHGTDPISLILIGFAVAAAYALSLYVKPLRRCPGCEGTGAKRARTGRPTGALCRRCRGTGRTRRLGATAVHRFYWTALGDRLREQRRAAHDQHHQHTDNPGI